MAVEEESSPLIGKTVEQNDAGAPAVVPEAQYPAVESGTEGGGYHWTANGLPLEHGSVLGEPMRRVQWDSGLFSCLGRNDEFCGSDVEVCLLGSVAPCVLYGSNVERLGSTSGTFSSHCLTYTGLYLMGYSLFGWNCLASWFSYNSRSGIRRKFNLEGRFEAFNRSCGCCGSLMEDEVRREHCETACDFGTHLFCHLCALCQEGRELRRRLPHPGLNAKPVPIMIPPGEQSMHQWGLKERRCNLST